MGHIRKGIPTRDPEFREHVKEQVCGLSGEDAGPCSGPVEAAHLPPRGEGRKAKKASDYFCVPLCRRHHREHHQGRLTEEQIRIAQVHGFRVLVRWLDLKNEEG